MLGETLNSQLGAAHLAFIYRQMAADPTSYVGVAWLDGQVAGVVSGTLNAEGLKRRFLRRLSLPLALNLVLRLLKTPTLLAEFRKSDEIGAPVIFAGQPLPAILTTIAVAPRLQGRGVGAGLVTALESFFVSQGVSAYYLDTLLSNLPARAFYRQLGFRELETRADSVILVKRIQHAPRAD